MKRHNILSIVSLMLLWAVTSGCAFNFALTSQRTALENQVMGTYAELEDDLVLVASVRAEGAGKPLTLKEKASLATQNRRFNQDDVDEQKARGILGEENSGKLVILSGDIGNVSSADEATMKLARILIEEENRDRSVQWDYTIASNENLTATDLNNVRTAFAKLQRDRAKPGEWIQLEDNRWIQKTELKQIQTSDEDDDVE